MLRLNNFVFDAWGRAVVKNYIIVILKPPKKIDIFKQHTIDKEFSAVGL